jgi:hypothetical protein
MFRGLLVGRLERFCDLIGRNSRDFRCLILSTADRYSQVDANFIFGATRASLQSFSAERHRIKLTCVKALRLPPGLIALTPDTVLV